MLSARDLQVQLISSRAASECMQRWHYSGRVVQNSQVHFGAFAHGKLLGAMSFGPPMDRSKVIGLVHGTAWDGMLELNRMAFSDVLPRNSESRCLAYATRLLASHYDALEWLLSFADGVQCGDGAIYRAAGWLLTAVAESSQILESPTGERFARMAVTEAGSSRRREALASVGALTAGSAASSSLRPLLDGGFRVIPGHMMRYIRPLRSGVLERFATPVLPYSAIDAAGARIYRGQRPPSIDDAPTAQVGDGDSTRPAGSNPSPEDC